MSFKYTVLTLYLLFAPALGNGLIQKSVAHIQNVFDDVDSIHHEVINLSDYLLNRIQTVTSTSFYDKTFDIFFVYHNGFVCGYGISDIVQSKSSLLPFLVVVNKQGLVQLVTLLDAPDPRSAKLLSPFWKKQFVGKKEITTRDINAISGATISSTDITQGVIRQCR